MTQAEPAPAVGPGVVPPGTRLMCLPGSLPAAEGVMRVAETLSIGPRNTRVRLYGDDEGRERRIPNELLVLADPARHAAAYGLDPLDVALPTGRYCASRSFSPGRWLPRWSWVGWTLAEHLAYTAGTRPLEGEPPAAPRRLVVVPCGARKTDRPVSDAHAMYVGSYHRSARRAADALMARSPGRFGTGDGTDCYQIILSARYGLLDLFDVISRYELRLGQPGSIGVDTLRYQAWHLGVLGAPEVIVLAGRDYADMVSAVWPHAIRPLDGTASIGEQLQRLAAIATTGTIPEQRQKEVATVATDTLTRTTTPATVRPTAGSVIDCPQPGCGNPAKIRRDGRIGAHKRGDGQKCPLAGRAVPAGVNTRPPAPMRADPFAEMSEVFAALLGGAVREPAHDQRRIPLETVTCGMYGEVKAMGHDGSRCTRRGYIAMVPRSYTGGAGGDKTKYKGQKLLSFWLDIPPLAGQRGGITMGMYALPGTMFDLMDPPADRPPVGVPFNGRRLPVADLQALDVIRHRHDGPLVHLFEDPKPLGDGQYALKTSVDGRVETPTLPGDLWVTITDSSEWRWQPGHFTGQPDARVRLLTTGEAGQWLPVVGARIDGVLVRIGKAKTAPTRLVGYDQIAGREQWGAKLMAPGPVHINPAAPYPGWPAGEPSGPMPEDHEFVPTFSGGRRCRVCLLSDEATCHQEAAGEDPSQVAPSPGAEPGTDVPVLDLDAFVVAVLAEYAPVAATGVSG